MREPNRSVVVDQVNWSDILLISRIPQALALSFQPSRIIMGCIIIVLLMASGAVWDAIAGPTVGYGGLGTRPGSGDELQAVLRAGVSDPVVVREVLADELRGEGALDVAGVREAILETYRDKTAEERERDRVRVAAALETLGQIEPMGVFEATAEAVVDRFHGMVVASLHFDLGALVHEIGGFGRIVAVLFRDHLLFAIIFGIWTLIVGMLGLATITRTAACQFTIEQYLTWTTALSFALKRWVPILGTVALPAVALGLGALALAVGGLLLAVPGLNIVGSILYGVALFGGLVAACLILLTLLASSLFIPAVAVESADAPDALARGFSFVRNRPLHWIVYMIAALLLGLLGLVIVTFIAALAINFTAWGASLFVDPPAVEALGGGASMTHLLPGDQGWALVGTHRITGGIIVLWRTLVGGLVGGWVLSYFACATTIVYLLMRKATDDQDLEEIWQPGLIEGTMAPGRAAVVDAGEAS